jgi:hypothetical protein
VKKLDEDIKKKFEKTAEKIQKLVPKLKPVGKEYVPEAIGIPKKAISHSKSKEIVHPYALTTKKLYTKWKKGATKKDFGKYVKEKASSSDKKAMKRSTVQYLTQEEAKKYIVEFKDRKLKQGGHTLKDGDYIYVLNMKMTKLFVGVKKKGEFHHSSFTAGTPVACAGGLKIKDGKISSINLKSGHYKPTKEQGENMIKFLKDDSRLGSKAKDLSIS